MYFKQDFKETALRSFFILSVIALILGLSMDKILIAFNISEAETNVVSLEIQTLTQFPVWPSFMCGKGITNVIAQAVRRGKSGEADGLTDLPSNFIKPLTTEALAPGDWTEGDGVWPCFEFNTAKQLNFTPGVIDQVILKAYSDQTPKTPATPANNGQTGLLFGIFDALRTMKTVDPFVAPIPSRNTFTFTKNERFSVNETYFTYFFVNKQNIIAETGPFGDDNTIATFAYSPDTFVVMTYKEKKPFTPYGLFSSVGGLITYSVAAWVILFGRGKYRSWGLIQRYLLRNSPDATKNDNNNRLFPSFNEKPKSNDIESQTHLVVTPSPGIDDKSFRPTSMFYFNQNQPNPNFNPLLSPNSSIMSPTGSIQSKDIKDFNKLIDAKINQKLWFVEQTLSRHYLSGFRLRRYDVDPTKLGTPYDEVDEPLTPPTARHSWQNMESGIPYRDNRNIQNTTTPTPPLPQNLTPHSSQYFQKNNGSVNSFNPEEQRSQYPNVALGQIPFDKKQKGSGVFQLPINNNDIAVTGAVTNNAYDGSYASNMPVSMPPSMPPSSYSPNVPGIQLSQLSDNTNMNSSPLSQLQASLSQGSHISLSNNQGHNQGSLQQPGERW